MLLGMSCWFSEWLLSASLGMSRSVYTFVLHVEGTSLRSVMWAANIRHLITPMR